MPVNKDLKRTWWEGAVLVFWSPFAIGFYLGYVFGWLIHGVLL